MLSPKWMCSIYVNLDPTRILENTKFPPYCLGIEFARNDNAANVSTVDKVANCKEFIFPVGH